VNERIRELAKEAGYYLYDLTETHECKTIETDSKDEWITLEKFAELILRDAIAVIEATPTQHCAYTTYDKTVVDCTVQKIIASLHSKFELTKIYKAPQ